MIYKVAEGFLGTEINPITNKKYDSSWIAYCLTNSDEYEIMTGGGVKSVYTLFVSKQYPNWKMSLMDFIEFQEKQNKNIILSASDSDIEEAKLDYHNHHFNDGFLRDYEPKVMVHSTTINCWESIKNDNCLKSWNKLKEDKPCWEQVPVGKQLGDPEDFSDYIMFSSGTVSSEIVVLSKQVGKLTMDENQSYMPGVRLYFDMERVAKDGLLIRDGCHLKVKDALPLNPYIIWVADWKSVGLENEYSTPDEFTKLANRRFNEIYGENIF